MSAAETDCAAGVRTACRSLPWSAVSCQLLAQTLLIVVALLLSMLRLLAMAGGRSGRNHSRLRIGRPAV